MEATGKTKAVLLVTVLICVLVGLAIVSRSLPTGESTSAARPSGPPLMGQEGAEPAMSPGDEAVEPATSGRDEDNAPGTADVAVAEDLVLDDVWADMRDRLGRDILEMEAIPIANPPASVSIEFKPALGTGQDYKSFSRACDEEGNILEDGVASSQGMWMYEVVKTDDANGSYTVVESLRGEQFTIGPNGKMNVRKLPPHLFDKTFTYARDGSLLRAEYKGRDVTAQFRDVPQLSFPQKELHAGDTWVCGGDPNVPWKIEARISGFARISGHNCLVVAFDELHQPKTTEPGVPKIESITRRGKQYIDYETMIPVRKEYVEITKGDFGTTSAWAVRHLTD